MQKRRYEILLPLQYNDGRPVSEKLFNQTRRELVSQFGGLSVYPGAIHGVWQQAGSEYQDALQRFVVDVDDTPENQQFFLEFKNRLLQRFEQLEIYVVSFLIDVL